VLIPQNNYHIKNPKNEIEEEEKNANEFNLTLEMKEFLYKKFKLRKNLEFFNILQ